MSLGSLLTPVQEVREAGRPLAPRVNLKDGVATLAARPSFRMDCVHSVYDATLVATSESFDALIDLRYQLLSLGYAMKTLESTGDIR